MNPTLAPEVMAALQDFTAQLEARVPIVGAILAEARATGASEADVMARLMLAVKDDPELASEIERVASTSLAVLRDPEVPAARPSATDVVLPPRREGGLPRINPLYSAALQEKIQFDGDVPELRTGPLPEGATPAVPVATDARDAVAIGWMLDTAAAEVAAEMRAIEGAGAEEVRLLTEGDAEGSTGLAARDPAVLAKLDKGNLPDPVGYERGQVPALREVVTPTAPELAWLSPEQRGQLAWKFVSTTQGRRTATTAIRKLVVVGMVGDGFDVEAHEGEPLRLTSEEVLAYAEWVVDLGGPGSVQPGFAFVDTAAKVLIKKLEDALYDSFADRVGQALRLEVITVNTVDVRKVGWAARVSARGTS